MKPSNNLMVETLIKHLKTYIRKEKPNRWTRDTVILDCLYFFGLSVDEGKYLWNDGFRRFVCDVAFMINKNAKIEL